MKFMGIDGGISYGGFNKFSYGIQPDGSPITRTKQSHPYSYDPFVIWENSPETSTSTIYTDRLLQWDFPKHDELCQKHFGNKGQIWSDRDPRQIEAFLRDWVEDNLLILTRVSEYCNHSNGYPLWRLDYKFLTFEVEHEL